MGILDAENCIIGVLAGCPNDKGWPTLHKKAAIALEEWRPKVHISKYDLEHTPRRGAFTTLHCGISYGGGQIKPSNLKNHPTNETILNELNSMEVFKRIAGFSSCMSFKISQQMYP